MANFPRIRSTFGVTPYNPERDTDEKRRAIFEHYQDQVSTQPMPEESMPWNVPFPPGVALQEEFDEMLQKRVVDPLSRAGYEDLGAGLAAVPSAAHSMIVPQTEFDVAGTIIPLPNVAKAMKKGKFRKIRNAMKAEDPENVAGIIAKQAGKEVPPSIAIEGPKAEVRAIDEKEMLRKADEANAMEASKLKWEAKRLEEEPIREGIKKKYGLDSENWSTKDSEADPEFGISDVSGKRGNLIEITDGETTLAVLENEYLDIMGLSGGIGLDETPFYKAMKSGIKDNKDALKAHLERKQIESDDEAFDEPKFKAPLKLAEPPKPPKGDPRLTKEQLGQLKAEIKKIESEIDQLNPSDPDYDFMLDKRKGRLLEIIETIDDSLKSLTRNRSKVVKPSKPPKGDPEASLRGPFQSIRSQLDVAPARMDERGEAFENIGQSDFMPYERPQVGQFEDVQKRNYVESELGKPLPDLYPTFEGRLFQQQYMDKKPDEIENVEVLMQILGGRGPAHEASILQSKMYPPKPKEPEKFGKIKEQIGEKSVKPGLRAIDPSGRKYEITEESLIRKPRLRVIKVSDGKDITDSFGARENLAGISAEELQKIVDSTGKRYKVIEESYVPSGQKNTQGKYYVTDWAGNEIDELGTYDSTEDAYDEITEWLRSKGVDEDDLDLEVGEFSVRRRKK